ncbi:hypothetical protein ACROYT_G013651 [Oculina patagonica]
MAPTSTVMMWKVVVLLRVVQFSTQQSVNSGHLILEPGETLHINTTEPSAIVADNQGNTKYLIILAERNHSFINHLGNAREWKYGIARLVFEKDIIFNSNSNVNIFGENALSIKSLEGNIVVKTMMNLSCAVTVLGGKCIGGYMPINKPEPDLISTIIPGNGPGGTSVKYLQYWVSQCIGGSGHGGKGGNPAYQDIQVYGYSGLEYGQKDNHVLIGGSSGSYLERSGYMITKPGHGGGAIQFVAKKGSIVIEAKIKANGQQTQGSYEIYSGSSGGLISLEANEVQIKNGGSLEVNGAHAGKIGHSPAVWSEGAAGGGGGIVHILAKRVFITTGSISLAPGNSTGCENKERTSPGYLSIRDYSGDLSMSWNNTSVFPVNSKGFTWPQASSETYLPSPTQSNSLIFPLVTQPSFISTATVYRSFSVVSFPMTNKLLTRTASYSSEFSRHSMLESQGVMYTSSAVEGSHSVPHAALTSSQYTTAVYHNPTATALSTGITVVTSASPVDTYTSEWEQLLKNVTSLKIAMGTLDDNSWIHDIQKLVQQFQRLAEKESLTEKTTEPFLEILKQLRDIVNMIPADKHQDTMKSVVASLMTTAELSFEKRNEEMWITTEKLPTVLRILENITLTFGKTTTAVNHPFKFEHYSQRTVVQVVAFKNNGNNITSTPFILPDITRTNMSIWNDKPDAVLIPSNVVPTSEDEITVSIIIHRNITNIHPTRFTELREEQANTFQVASHIISCSVQYNSRLVKNVSFPVELHFPFQGKRGFHSLCAFWDHRISTWSTEGLRTLQTNKTHASCHSAHLTSFAILTQFKDVKISEEDELALSIITYIGCGLSIACLFVTLLVYLAFETLSTERHKIHMSLAFALLMAQSLFLSGINAVGYKILCRVLAVGLHYLFSAAFMWMCIEGFHLYVMIVSVFRADRMRMKYYHLIGWGFPVIIVGVAAAVHPTGYGTSTICWLSTEDQFIWVFLAPIVAVIVINFIVLAAVIKVVTDSASATLTQADYGHVKAGVKSVAVLLPLLGVSWVFGLLTVNKKMIAFQYIFAISNGFQGVFIFLAHCVGSSDVRSAFKRMRQRQLLSRGSDNVSSFMASQVNSPGSAANVTKQDVTEHKSAKKLQEKMRFSLRSLPNSKVVKVKPTKDKFEAAHLQISRTYQMSHMESPSLKDYIEMPFLNCPQDVSSLTQSSNRRRSSKPFSRQYADKAVDVSHAEN